MNPVAAANPADVEGPVGPIDGRTLRRTRNRDAVITALLDMIREGDRRPAAADIAERAGVSHRSIFRYFADLDDLVRTTIDAAFEQAGPYSEVPDIGVGTFEERVATYVDARLRLHDFVDGPMQVARIRAATIPSIDERLAEVAEEFRGQVRTHFANELARIEPPDDEYVVDAVRTLTSYDVYSLHQRLLSSSREHLRQSWIATLRRLLRP